jgi:hypothetical protein
MPGRAVSRAPPIRSKPWLPPSTPMVSVTVLRGGRGRSAAFARLTTPVPLSTARVRRARRPRLPGRRSWYVLVVFLLLLGGRVERRGEPEGGGQTRERGGGKRKGLSPNHIYAEVQGKGKHTHHHPFTHPPFPPSLPPSSFLTNRKAFARSPPPPSPTCCTARGSCK